MTLSVRYGQLLSVCITNDDLERQLEVDEACFVCYDILLTAVTMDRCAHRICGSCADELLERSCPMCRVDFVSVTVDADTRRRMGEVPARCTNLCGFQGTVHDVLQHRKSDCPSQTVYCRREGCSSTVERSKLDQHEDQCGYKKVTCPCGFKTTKMYLDRHLATECAAQPIPCPVGCENVIERAKVVTHVVQECPRTVSSCSVPGCGFVGRADDMAAHSVAVAEKHVKLLLHHATQLKLELASGKLKRSDASLVYGRIEAMTFTIPDLKRKITEGSTAFTSPECMLFNGKWQVSLQKDETTGWHIYLCLVSRALPLHLKVMFLLLAPGQGEDHGISMTGKVEVSENRKYGAPVTIANLMDYSEDSRLMIKALLQEVSATVV
ncbi:PREDICTED: TNF receptor-associated factor 6-like isoform X2 [Branchiostoma belcheri]|uniref:TNF receptor-associated factor 6-like isoform X2 n=1 Tax=Branchiostoma belcheri TaxID=7741 RepID=A0A6P4YDV7_BRABE|nr:PREDICTED: TNF receptor-associated factor 6-like isoform X2 [Branchiostoma belcheri]